MTREDKYLLGCLHAISTLLDEGSIAVMVQDDGKWERIPWKEIYEWIDAKIEDMDNIYTQLSDKDKETLAMENKAESEIKKEK